MHHRGYSTEIKPAAKDRYPVIRLFSWPLRLSWALLFAATVATELIPRDPLWMPHIFYPYTAMKAVLFVLLGFVSPLAIWKFDSLGWGIAFAAAAAGSVEGAQHFLAGHHASFLEFGLKLLLLLFGFLPALVARHDRLLQIGPFGLRFHDAHFKEES